jgi:hypothetical protein
MSTFDPELPQFTWDLIEASDGSQLKRAKVHGGWLVRADESQPLTFIPDTAHQWQVRIGKRVPG